MLKRKLKTDSRKRVVEIQKNSKSPDSIVPFDGPSIHYFAKTMLDAQKKTQNRSSQQSGGNTQGSQNISNHQGKVSHICDKNLKLLVSI